MEWKAIETAPKDGSVIDLWHPEYGRYTDVWWDEDDQDWATLFGFVSGFTHWMLVIPPNCKLVEKDD